MVKIFIDPGHGGSDPGATANGLQEKNLTLAIATEMRNILENEYDNVTIQMSRTNDTSLSLSQRTTAANNWNADYFISVHINAGGGTGFESFIYPGVGAPTTTYQTNVHNAIIAATNFRNRGMKRANFHVLRESNMPAILTENGFIDNSSDATSLKNPNFISSIARGHVNGIAAAFSLPRKQNPSEGNNNGSGQLYRVQIGAFRERSNADQLVAHAESIGFSASIAFVDNLYKVQIGAFSDLNNAKNLESLAIQAGLSTVIVTV